MSQNHFEDKLQKKTSSFAPKPKPETWKNIEKALDKDKKKRVFFIFKMAAALVVTASAILFFIYKNQNREPELFTQNHSDTETVSSDTKSKSPTDISENSAPQISKDIDPKSIPHKSSSANPTQHPSAQKEQAPSKRKTVVPTQTESHKLEIPKEPKIASKSQGEDLYAHSQLDLHQALPYSFEFDFPEVQKSNLKPIKAKIAEISIGFFAGLNHIKTEVTDNENQLRLFLPSPPSAVDQRSKDKPGSGHQYGVNLGYRLNRLRLSLGVQKTLISYSSFLYNLSENPIVTQSIGNGFNTEATDSFTVYQQTGSPGYIETKLSYISIPLNLKYTVLKYRKTELALQSGIMYHRLQSSSGVTPSESPGIYTKQNRIQESSLTQNHWSAQVGVELIYRLNRNWETGLSFNLMKSLTPFESSAVLANYSGSMAQLRVSRIIGL